MNVNKALYKPVGAVVGVVGGVAASAVFGKVWAMATGEKDAPKATDPTKSWRAVLVAATVQGAVYGLVKAAIDRAGAAGYRKATGEWPDD
jgi:uncharacterized protein DUF4235